MSQLFILQNGSQAKGGEIHFTVTTTSRMPIGKLRKALELLLAEPTVSKSNRGQGKTITGDIAPEHLAQHLRPADIWKQPLLPEEIRTRRSRIYAINKNNAAGIHFKTWIDKDGEFTVLRDS